MKTEHWIYQQSAEQLTQLDKESVHLIVTSPPYPMIEMWDEILSNQNPQAGISLENNDGRMAFEKMHALLDKVWKETERVLKPGGIACINIGDATRKIGNDFQLYSNHSRILQSFFKIGLSKSAQYYMAKTE